MTGGGDHWGAVARQWHAIGRPLRPGPADIEVVVGAARRLRGPRRRAVVLGVTPELAAARWPAGTDLWAIDHHAAMVDALWAGPPGSAVLGDWTALPVGDGAVDLAVCDGGLHLLDRAVGQPALAAELARTLAVDGRFVLRLFGPPAASVTTSVAEVFDRVAAGEIADPNQLKVALWMAVRTRPHHEVALATVWSALSEAHPDLDALADTTGWDRSAIRALESYRNSPATYHFVELDEVVALLASSGSFELESVHGAGDPASMAFPTLVFRRHA